MSVFDFGVKRPEDFSPMTDEILEKTTVWQFEQIVEKYPDRMALKDATQSLNYRELNNACNNLAQQIIQELGSGKSPVAFLLGNEILSIIAFMAASSGAPACWAGAFLPPFSMTFCGAGASVIGWGVGVPEGFTGFLGVSWPMAMPTNAHNAIPTANFVVFIPNLLAVLVLSRSRARPPARLRNISPISMGPSRF